jgi:hypothetical protein
MKRAINLLNVALLAMCGYIWGHYDGMNYKKEVDNRVAIQYAVYKAIAEGN